MPALLEKVMREKQGMQSDALLAGHTEWAPAKVESKAKQSARRMEELRQNSKPGTSPYHAYHAALSVPIEYSPRGFVTYHAAADHDQLEAPRKRHAGWC